MRVFPVGQGGESLPNECEVYRKIRPTNMDSDLGTVTPAAFEFNSSDKESDPWKLSVFETTNTSPEQVLALTGSNSGLICGLSVEEIRQLKATPELPDVPPLDVIWDPAVLLSGEVDSRPGAEGHASIIGGLSYGKSAGGNSKLIRKSFRSQLADLGSKRLIRIPS